MNPDEILYICPSCGGYLEKLEVPEPQFIYNLVCKVLYQCKICGKTYMMKMNDFQKLYFEEIKNGQ